jgi:hypothetical protein
MCGVMWRAVRPVWAVVTLAKSSRGETPLPHKHEYRFRMRLVPYEYRSHMSMSTASA